MVGVTPNLIVTLYLDINLGIIFCLMTENNAKLQTLIIVWTTVFSRMITWGIFIGNVARFRMSQACHRTKITFLVLIFYVFSPSLLWKAL